MANERFRDWVNSRISEAIRTHEEAQKECHGGLAGLAREIAIEMLFRPFLPPGMAIGTGKIIDSRGGESTQLDVILYNAAILPAAMFGTRLGLYPIEACLYAIEIKSTASARGAEEVRQSARSLAALAPQPGYIGIPAEIGGEAGGRILTAQQTGAGFYPNYSYFAFSTDLAPNGLLPRERERVLSGVSHHDIHFCSLCIAGSVTSSWSDTKSKWIDVPASERYDEIAYFLSTILHTVAKMRVMRPYPNIGKYMWGQG